jgi:hypothetical protein
MLEKQEEIDVLLRFPGGVVEIFESDIDVRDGLRVDTIQDLDDL